jgi:NAD(P)-dependent dehydrogenase (short-subunit alcohol dehydrogenase family)
MNPIDYNGKTAVITGAASGMGFCASEELVRLGATVVMCDINAELLEKAVGKINTVGPGRALACVCDVRKFSDAEKAAVTAVNETGRIDLLVTFAGGYEPRICGTCGVPFYEQPVKVLDWGIDVNLKGPFYFAHAALKYMREQRSGLIVNIGSISGAEGNGYDMDYPTSKAGLMHGLTKCITQFGARYGIRCVCVSPGPVLTRAAMANMKTPLGRAAEPQEIIDLILFIASEKGQFINGENIMIDGGRNALKREKYH